MYDKIIIKINTSNMKNSVILSIIISFWSAWRSSLQSEHFLHLSLAQFLFLYYFLDNYLSSFTSFPPRLPLNRYFFPDWLSIPFFSYSKLKTKALLFILGYLFNCDHSNFILFVFKEVYSFSRIFFSYYLTKYKMADYSCLFRYTLVKISLYILTIIFKTFFSLPRIKCWPLS
jgi:hypothetical protein